MLCLSLQRSSPEDLMERDLWRFAGDPQSPGVLPRHDKPRLALVLGFGAAWRRHSDAFALAALGGCVRSRHLLFPRADRRQSAAEGRRCLSVRFGWGIWLTPAVMSAGAEGFICFVQQLSSFLVSSSCLVLCVS